MNKILKYFLIPIVGLIGIAFIALKVFQYKIENGFEKVETTPHNITFPASQPAILLFSKTTGFRHGASIKASSKKLPEMAIRNGWFLYSTEDAGVINKEELNQFDIIIWNNSTGIALTESQRALVEKFIRDGGGFIGIHGAGDGSHHWDFYLSELIGARFSHHAIQKQIQTTTVTINALADSMLTAGLGDNWQHEDEWYVFFDNAIDMGFHSLYQIDGDDIDTNGNVPFLVSDKDFGMGKNQSVTWYKEVGLGKTFYTALGHQGQAYDDPNFIRMIENAIKWELQ